MRCGRSSRGLPTETAMHVQLELLFLWEWPGQYLACITRTRGVWHNCSEWGGLCCDLQLQCPKHAGFGATAVDVVDGAVTAISISGLQAVNTSQVCMQPIPIHTAHSLGSQPRHTSAAGRRCADEYPSECAEVPSAHLHTALLERGTVV